MAPARKWLFWFAWSATFGLSVLCGVIVVQGILRDRRIGEPVLALDVSQQSDWRVTRFRVWGEGTYRLFIATVNWDSTHVGAPLGATLEVAVLTPNGSAAFQQQYAPDTTGLVLPINYGDAQLADLSFSDWPFRRWTLQARVLTPDERFKMATTSVKLYKQRYDPGMGGMMNYVMIFPAGLFLVVASFTALSLAKRGSRVPLVVTLLWGTIFVVLFAA
jgi:hypothetical protein